MKKFLLPFKKITKKEGFSLLFFQLIFVLIFLELGNFNSFPKPTLIIKTLASFLLSIKVITNVILTLLFMVNVFFISISITLVLSYAWTINFFKYFVEFVIKCRYLPFTCVVFIFSGFSNTFDDLKYYLLLFGLVPYYVNSFVDIIKETISEGVEINKSFINKNNHFETLYEVIILGKIDKVFDIISQNFAISWTLITTVETLSTSSGGIGVLITSDAHHMKIEEIISYGIIILTFGILIDKGIILLKKSLIKW